MRTIHIFLLCILGASLLSSVLCTNGIGPDSCCFTFYPRKVKKDLLQSYFIADHRCPKDAVIFVTVKGRRICMDPNLKWVQSIMKNLDEKNF